MKFSPQKGAEGGRSWVWKSKSAEGNGGKPRDAFLVDQRNVGRSLDRCPVGNRRVVLPVVLCASKDVRAALSFLRPSSPPSPLFPFSSRSFSPFFSSSFIIIILVLRLQLCCKGWHDSPSRGFPRESIFQRREISH